MSILQEYEEYRRKLGEKEWKNIDNFLAENDQYLLSDVLYKESVWKIYENWKRKWTLVIAYTVREYRQIQTLIGKLFTARKGKEV